MSLKEEIQSRLNELGASPKRSLGQNFLIDPHVVEKIIAAVNDLKPQALIEIGPGAGSLTVKLRDLGLELRLIELDRDFAKYWQTQGCTVIEGDALQLDWTALAVGSGSVLVSNLPYQISSSLVIDRSLGPAEVGAMVLMFQKEVAQRIAAKPRGKEYGLLSVVAQLFWEIKTVVEAGPRSFWPAPKVASRVLAFRRRAGAPLGEGLSLLRFIKAAFSHRRKILWKNLASECQRFGVEQEQALKWGQDLGLGPQVRAEELKPQQFYELYLAFNSRKGI